MAWEYTTSDRVLRGTDQFKLELAKYSWEGQEITGCRTGAKIGDKNPRIGQSPPVSGSANDPTVHIEFQFPPKVLSDGRKGNWEEGDLTGGEEPVAVFKTSGPREITLAWTYIVDSFNTNSSDTWTIERITRQVRTLRGYFALSRGREANRDGLVVKFSMWCIGGDEPITGRIKGVDVKYGETMVFPPGGSAFADRAYPLRTDITVDFRVWTKGMRTRAPIGDDDKGLAISAQDIKKLVRYEPPSWY